jgi:dimethylsulfone monooxygenase
MLGINSQTLPPGVEQQLKAHFIAGWGGFPLVGTKEQIVDGLGLLSKVGFDGVILSWARYVEEMRQFQAETLPLLEQAGLR